MKLATTIGDFEHYCNQNPTAAVRAFEGTGFKHLDYSFYNVMRAGSPFMGKDYLEEVKEAGKEAEKLGFDFVQAHSPGNNPFWGDFDGVVNATLRCIEACGYLGIPGIVIHPGFGKEYVYHRDEQAFWEANRKFFEKLAPAAEKYNVNLLAENGCAANMGQMCFPMSGKDLVDFIDYCRIPRLHACWDVGHANLQNPNQYEDIVTLGKHLGAVHIQDNMGGCDEHLAPFMGTLDIDAVLRGLFDSGFVDRGGYFTFEADNIIARAGAWPHTRNKSMTEEKVATPSLSLKRAAISFLYQIGKEILSAYGCFED